MTSIDALGRSHSEIGLYLRKIQSEPDVHLDPMDDGTFLFPPSEYPDASSFARFWNSVKISDGVLSNITVGYAEFIRKEAIKAGNGWGMVYDRENEAELHHKSPDREAAADAARAKAYDAFIAEWYENHPKKIQSSYARSIARAGQLFYYSGALTVEQQDEVIASTMTLNGKDMTIQEIYSSYQLQEIRSHFQDPEVTSSERLEDLRIELQRLQVR